MLDTVVKHSFIVGVYWVAFTAMLVGFMFSGNEKRLRLDIYDFVLISLYVLSAIVFVLILI